MSHHIVPYQKCLLEAWLLIVLLKKLGDYKTNKELKFCYSLLNFFDQAPLYYLPYHRSLSVVVGDVILCLYCHLFIPTVQTVYTTLEN